MEDIDMYGIWQDFPKNKPNNGDRVLIRVKGSGENWEPAIYNEKLRCWDDIEGNYMYELESVDKFMLISKVD